MGSTENLNKARILVIRFSSLGDLVLLVPLLWSLRKGYPRHSLELVTKKKYAPLFRSISWIDNVHELQRESFPSLLSLASRLRAERYELLIDAHDVLRSRLLCLMVRAGRRFRLEKDQLKKTLLIKSGRNLYTETPSMVDRYLSIADRLGLERREGEGSLDLAGSTVRTAAAGISEAGLDDKRLIAVAPGARYPAKRWPEANYAVLTEKLTNAGFGVVLVGGTEERELCGRIAGNSGSVLNAAGMMDVPETAALLARCECLVTNDSAPLHISEVTGTPVVAIFGPTVREFGFYPRLERSILLEKDCACRPCSRNGSKDCRLGTNECLTLIGVEEVFHAAMRITGIGSTAGPGSGGKMR